MVNPIDDFIEFKFTVDKDDLINGVLQVVSQIKPLWTADKIKHTVRFCFPFYSIHFEFRSKDIDFRFSKMVSPINW